jgi:hypothetical protein
MLGFSFFAWTDCLPAPISGGGDGPETSPQVEITAEPGIELDVGDGAMLTES